MSDYGAFVRDFDRLSRRFRHQLRLTGAVHCNEEPRSFIHRAPYGEQTVILQNGSFIITESLGNAITFRGVVHDAGVIGKEAVILIERTSVLRQGIKQSS